jgi:hypothetical protein
MKTYSLISFVLLLCSTSVFADDYQPNQNEPNQAPVQQINPETPPSQPQLPPVVQEQTQPPEQPVPPVYVPDPNQQPNQN